MPLRRREAECKRGCEHRLLVVGMAGTNRLVDRGRQTPCCAQQTVIVKGKGTFIYLPFIHVIYLLALHNTVYLDMQCSLRSDSLSLIP